MISFCFLELGNDPLNQFPTAQKDWWREYEPSLQAKCQVSLLKLRRDELEKKIVLVKYKGPKCRLITEYERKLRK